MMKSGAAFGRPRSFFLPDPGCKPGHPVGEASRGILHGDVTAPWQPIPKGLRQVGADPAQRVGGQQRDLHTPDDADGLWASVKAIA